MGNLELSYQTEGKLTLNISGEWKLGNLIPSADDIKKQIESRELIKHISFDATRLISWDSSLLAFLMKLNDYCLHNKIHVEKESLPEGIRRLMKLASEVPERKGARRLAVHIPFLERIGESVIDFWHLNLEMLGFIGEAFIAMLRLLTGKAKLKDQNCGPPSRKVVHRLSQ